MKLSPNDEDRLWREREPEKTPWFRFSSPLRYIVFLIILVLLLVCVWYLIAPSRQWYDKADLVLIRADQTPYKMKAENQGVPGVKHQDKLVYGRIRGDQNQPVAEHILPDPEAPLPEIKEQGVTLKMVEQYAPEDCDPNKEIDTVQKTPEKSVSSYTSIEELIEETSHEKKDSHEGKNLEKTSVKGKTFVQLGSLKSYDLAESEWARLSKKQQDVLRGLEPVIQKVDLGEEQGIYYRLRTGPFESIEKANEVCASLKMQKVECLVVP